MNNLLILDKSAFHGTAFDKLLRFVKCHDVILLYTLCVECTISRKGDSPKNSKDPERLMHRLLELVKNGAYVGKSPARIVEEERSRQAVIESLIDEEQTQIMREAILVIEEPGLEKARVVCEKLFKPIVNFVQQFVGPYYKEICRKKAEQKFRKMASNGNIVGRLGMWLQIVDKTKDVILDNFSALGGNAVFKDGWEWQMLRLGCAWGIELASKRNQSGPSFDNYKDLSNDIYDIHYVSHLAQAHGLVTHENEKKLMPSLAKAAFPGKDVFRDIDDVPFRYCVRKRVLAK